MNAGVARLSPSGDAGDVLVIDDSPAGRDFMHWVLSRAGYSVRSVTTIAEGAAAAATGPDVIVCDVNLPDGSGLDLAAQLRADPRTSDIPLLQVSAVRIASPDRTAGLRAGADAYLVYPIEPAELLAVLAALLRTRTAEGQVRAALSRLTELQALTAAMARASTAEDIRAYLAPALREAFGATGVGFGALEDAGTLIIEAALPFAFPIRWPVDRTTSFGCAVQTQEIVVLTDHRERRLRFPALADLVPDTEASVDLPLCTADGEVFGVLGLGWAEAGAVTPEVREDLLAIAAVAGQALHRAHLADAERQGRERLAALHRLTSDLSRAETQHAVADAALRHVGPALGAAGGAVVVRDDGTGRLRVLASTGTLPGRRSGVTGPERATGTQAARGRWDPVPVLLEGASHGALPLRTGGTDVGLLVLDVDRPDRPDAAERELAGSVAQAVADGLGRAQAVDRERAAFLDLQRKLLPRRLPELPGWELVGRYSPAADGSAVGGDWYDAVVQVSGSLTLIIGDVAGHGPSAAATMSHLRHAVHALAGLGMELDAVLGLVNRSLDPVQDDAFATLLAVTVDPPSGRLTVTSAGHPPAMLLTGDGAVSLLEAPVNRPLGVDPAWRFRSVSLPCPPAATLLLYTDGLIEDRRWSLDAGVDRLRETLAGQGHRPSAADDVLARCASDADDSALILARHRG